MKSASSDFQKLLGEARSGSAEAAGKLLASFQRQLKLTAKSSLDPAMGRKASASDLVQETLMRATRDLRDFRGATEGELLAWLRTILRRQTANAVQQFRNGLKRQIGREVFIDGPDSRGDWREDLILDTPTPGAKAAMNEEQQRLAASLRRLPDEYREVVRLHDFERRSWEEIGSLLGKSPTAARSLWYRAIMKLRDVMRNGDGDAGR